MFFGKSISARRSYRTRQPESRSLVTLSLNYARKLRYTLHLMETPEMGRQGTYNEEQENCKKISYFLFP
jgi:hypothetical protein